MEIVMRFRAFFAVFLAVFLAFSASLSPTLSGRKAEGPEKIVVQHILIGFKRSIAGKQITRTKREAGQLAEEIFKRAQEGEDFDALVKEYTDDQYPGYIAMANRGVDAMGGQSRDDMVPGFGDTSFALEVGEIALVPYHGRMSPYGWHIIKRLE
jgi:foldase protein PrsA